MQAFPFFKELLSFLQKDMVDILLIAVFVLYALEGYSLGFFAAFLEFLSFVISFALGLKYYSIVGSLISSYFGISKGIANALGYFILAAILEILLKILLYKLFPAFARKIKEGKSFKSLYKINHIGGIVPGLLSAFVLLSFLLSVLVSLPFSPVLSRTIASSKIGGYVLSKTSVFERNIHEVFGDAFHETLNFLTVEPQGTDLVKLNFSTRKVSIDESSETYMIQLVNNERSKRGLDVLLYDEKLTRVARKHSQDMFYRGYFSHYTPDGLSPFDRMDQEGVIYSAAGENLALAPTTDLAMEGLMNSPGHRANILSSHFKKIGIGVIDGGFYGEMFSQEFTD